MNKIPIAIYLQHYLSPSMTFIHRQLINTSKNFSPIVLCSDWLENRDRFPFEKIYLKRRNFIGIKKSRIVSKIIGWRTLLDINPRLSLQQKKYFLNVLNINNISLIHAHFGPAGLEILQIAVKLGLPLIVTFHGYDASMLLRFEKYRNNLKELFNYANMITVSKFIKNDLVKLGAKPEKINVIRCGIPVYDFDRVERIPVKMKMSKNEEISFLQVSNFVKKKGHKYTIKAFYNFLKTYKNAKLILAGEGQLKKEIYSLCKELNLLDNVSFPGLVNQDQVIHLMKNADVFVHHSVTTDQGDKEGIPTVLMEAMATGLPCISTYHSGIPELIDNNINGILVQEKDIDAFTNALKNLINIPDNLGIKARETVVKYFNLEIEMGKTFSLYNTLLNSN